MIKKIIKELIDKNITISFCESCTGGNLASTLTKVPGVSKIFKGSFVTYSNEYKEKFLNVKKETIEENGVVSSEVAYEMSNNLYNITKSNICVSVTGNAGPTKGDTSKDVGVVFVGITYNGVTDTYKLTLKGSRKHIINNVTKFVYNEIKSLII